MHASLSHGDKLLRVHDPGTLWVARPTTSGFTVCIRATGAGTNGTTEVDWLALLETGSVKDKDLNKGSIAFEKWGEGVKCKKVTLSKVSVCPINPVVALGIFDVAAYFDVADICCKNVLLVMECLTLFKIL